MSVIEEVINGLEALRSNPSSTVVDMLVKIHEQGLPGRVNSEHALRLISDSLLGKTASLTNSASPPDPLSNDPFPDFSAEQQPKVRKQLPVDAPANLDSVSELLASVLSSYQELLTNYNEDFKEIQARRTAGRTESDDEIIARLKDAQLLLLKYPIAGQALYAALIRQGREYAKTPQGAALKSQLAQSPVVGKARTLFEGITGGMLTEQNGELPSTYVDGFLEALDKDLEVVLSEVGGVDDAL